MRATERVIGNGIMYHINDVEDMVRVLILLKDVTERKRLGSEGAKKMHANFSWNSLAKRRLVDFEASLIS